MAKRANGEGNFRQRPNGRWEGRVSYVDPQTDQRRSVSVYGATAAECRKELKKVRKRVEEGQPAKDAPDTVGSWLASWRDSSLAASGRKVTTKAQYEMLSRKHLEPQPFGATRLDKLKPTTIERLIVTLRAKGLSDSTAVAWLESGVHIKAAADLLGHCSIAVTGDLYGHTSDNTARAAVDGLGSALGL